MTGKRAARLVLAVAGLAALLVVGIAGVAAWLVGTESGTRTLVTRGPALAGADVRVERVTGTVAGGLVLEGVAFARGPHRGSIASLAFEWTPRALLARRLHVRRLAATGVRYEGPSPAESGGDERQSFAFPAPPLDLVVDALTLSDAEIRTGGETRRIERLRLAARVAGDAVTVTALEVAADGLVLALEGEGSLAPPHPVRAEIRWTLDDPAPGPAAGAGTVTGDASRLRVEHRIERPFPVTVTGGATFGDDGPDLDLTARWTDLAWPPAGPPALASPAGEATVRGPLHALVLTLGADLATPGVPVERIDLALRGAVDPGNPPALDATVEWTAGLAAGETASGSGRVTGDPGGFVLEHALTRPFPVTARGTVRLGAGGLRFALDGAWTGARWPLTGPAGAASESGRFSLEGDRSRVAWRIEGAASHPGVPLGGLRVTAEGEAELAAPFPLRADLAWRGELAGGAEVRGTGSIRGDRARLALEHRVEGPLDLTTTGSVSLDGPSPVLALAGEWRGLGWPLGDAPRWRSESGTYRVEGPAGSLAVRLRGEAAGDGLPPAQVAFAGTLATGTGDGRLDVAALSIEALGGRLEATGAIALAPRVAWDAKVSARDVEPGRHWPRWPGRLALEARITGALEELSGTLSPVGTVVLERLSGTLRDRPLAGSGTVAFAPGRVRFDGIALRSGDNRLDANGTVGDLLDVEFTVEAPALDRLWPGLAGRLAGQGKVSGAAGNPRVAARLEGADLAFGPHRAGSIAADVDVDPENAGASRLTLTAGAVTVAGRPVGEVNLAGTGNASEHRLVARVAGPDGRLEATISGRAEGSGWRGLLESAEVEAPPAGVWRLAAPVALSARAGAGRVERGCLVRGDARACVEARLDPASGLAASALLEALPLAIARPWLPESLTVDGVVDGHADVTPGEKGLEVRAEVAPRPGRIVLRDPDDDQVVVDYRDARIAGTWAEDTGTVEVAVAFADGGRATGRLRVGAPAAGGDRSLAGRIEARLDDLSPVAAAVSRARRLEGRIEIAADVAGTVSRPEVTGTARLADGSVDVPDLGIEVRGLALEARNDGGDRVVLSGRARSGDGEIALAGEARLSAAEGWPAEIRITGDRFLAVRLPMVEARVSPDLRVTAAGGAIMATGRLDVPSARIRLRELPTSAVRVSEDEEIVVAGGSGVGTPDPAVKGSRIASRVEVTLGDDVHFSGFGLEAGLRGQLAIRTAPELGIPIANGDVNLVGGRYRAYGQDLAIERGRLLFAGPIDNPELDVRAVRKVGGVTAGIEVGGTAKSIRSRVTSTPSLPDAEALAYLLTGRPLSGASHSDAAMLSGAALSLGLGSSSMVTGRIASAMGLDEVTVGGGDELEQSSLFLGKYLTPELYLRYALGIFDEIGSVLLNYRLTDSISIEAESGRRQGMDVIYSIER